MLISPTRFSYLSVLVSIILALSHDPRSRATNVTTNSMPSFFSSRQPSLASLFSTP